MENEQFKKIVTYRISLENSIETVMVVHDTVSGYFIMNERGELLNTLTPFNHLPNKKEVADFLAVKEDNVQEN